MYKISVQKAVEKKVALSICGIGLGEVLKGNLKSGTQGSVFCVVDVELRRLDLREVSVVPI